VHAVLAAALAPVQQDYLSEARQMQALSFAVHIPLVCFGVAFPALVVFVEWLWRRTGDPLYRTLARRWTRVMVALFAVGVVTGTILSFELGLLWPNFMATFGGVFGLAFALEGFSFFLEAIFIAIYVYGWERLSPRAHFLCGLPIVLTGLTGSAMVIAVNGWMNHPQGFRLGSGGHVTDVNPWDALFGNRFLWHELVHMYVAAYIVVGFALAAVYAWGKLRHSRWGRYERTALAIPLTIAALAAPAQLLVGDWAAREVAVQQPVKLAAMEGLQQTTAGAPEHFLGWYQSSTGQIVGGIAQGLGQALIEEVVYDPATGQLLSGSFNDYGMLRSDTMPNITSKLEEIACQTNPVGVKGVGESGAIAAPPTLVNAVLDALRPLGVSDLQMPLSPARVWTAIHAAALRMAAAA